MLKITGTLFKKLDTAFKTVGKKLERETDNIKNRAEALSAAYNAEKVEIEQDLKSAQEAFEGTKIKVAPIAKEISALKAKSDELKKLVDQGSISSKVHAEYKTVKDEVIKELKLLLPIKKAHDEFESKIDANSKLLAAYENAESACMVKFGDNALLKSDNIACIDAIESYLKQYNEVNAALELVEHYSSIVVGAMNQNIEIQ